MTAGNNLVVGDETIIETNTAGCGINPPAIGNNVTLGFKVKLETCVEVGNGVVIGDESTVKANAIIGDHATLGAVVTVESGVVIGDGVTVPDGCNVINDSPPFVCPP